MIVESNEDNIIPIKLVIPIKLTSPAPIPTPKPVFRYVETGTRYEDKVIEEIVPGQTTKIRPSGLSQDQFIESGRVSEQIHTELLR